MTHMVEQKPQHEIENNTTTQERQMTNINFLHVPKEIMRRQVYRNEITRRLLQYRQCSMGWVTKQHRRREKLSFNSRLWAYTSIDLRRRKFGLVKFQLFKGRTYQPHVWIRMLRYSEATRGRGWDLRQGDVSPDYTISRWYWRRSQRKEASSMGSTAAKKKFV